MGAARLGEAPFAVAVARSFTAPEEASVISSGERVPAPMAALANGALIHALDYDDTHAGALVHATAAVLPAALAAGEQHRASGSEVLAACIGGYETVTRIGSAVRHGFHARGFHATSVCGVFASALVGSILAKLGPESAVNAMGIAGSSASGSLEFLNTGSSTKQLHPGLAALNGLLAARLAADGASGPDSILEGQNGLFRSYADTNVDPLTITEGLGSRWETTLITIKPYPACQLSHASLDALAQVRGQIGDLRQIESIVFDVPADSVSIVCEPETAKKAPRSPYEGKFSLAFSAAALLLEGALHPDSFESSRLTSPETLEIARTVGYRTTHPDEAIAEAPGRVEILLHGGQRIVGEVPTSRGGPKMPMDDGELTEKFFANCGLEYPSVELARLIMDMEQIEDISQLTKLIRPVSQLHRA